MNPPAIPSFEFQHRKLLQSPTNKLQHRKFFACHVQLIAHRLSRVALFFIAFRLIYVNAHPSPRSKKPQTFFIALYFFYFFYFHALANIIENEVFSESQNGMSQNQ